IASSAASYWRKPAALGGGARDFTGIGDVTVFGADSTNANGTFTMTVTNSSEIIVTATGSNEGVVVVATITQQGVQGTPVITMP
ncbi:MAG: hypothetical protein IIB41_04950, partial [Candidatus Marinimicrobia bacterium]|nr:hypothetical protein [Candidatus Neomarinimicrobiota bacterium]